MLPSLVSLFLLPMVKTLLGINDTNMHGLWHALYVSAHWQSLSIYIDMYVFSVLIHAIVVPIPFQFLPLAEQVLMLLWFDMWRDRIFTVSRRANTENDREYMGYWPANVLLC